MITKLKAKLSSDNNLKEIISGSAVTFALKMGGMLLGYLVVLVISKQFGAEGIGIYSLTLAVITFLAMLSTMGMDMSILRYVGQFNQENHHQKLKLLYKYVLEITVPVSITLSAVLFLLSDYIALHIFQNSTYCDALKIASFIIPFFAITNVNVEYIRGLKNLKISEFLRSVHRPIVNLLFLFILSIYFSNTTLPLYSLFIAIVFTCLVSLYFIYKKLTTITLKTNGDFSKTELIETSFPMLITSLSTFFMGNIALVFLQIYSTTDQVGIFSVALKISMLISLVLMVVNTISAPKFSELFWAKEYHSLQQVIHQSTKIIFFSSLLIAAVAVLFNTAILSLFGKEFIAGSVALLLLILGQLINAATGSVGIFLNMTGHQKILRNIVVISMLVSIALNYLLIPLYGINGAAFASMVCAILANISAAYYVKVHLGYTTYFVPSFLRRLS